MYSLKYTDQYWSYLYQKEIPTLEIMLSPREIIKINIILISRA